MKRIIGLALGFLLIAIGIAYAGHLNTSGRCPVGTCEIGSATNTSAFVINTSTTGNSAVQMAAGSIGSGEVLDGTLTDSDLGENAVKADELGATSETLFFCGESCNNSTCAGGHSVAFLSGDYSASHALAAAACDTLGETSIAAASEAVSANNAFKVTGMYCVTDSSGSNGVILAMTAADAAVVPAVTCTIPTGETTCSSVVSTTTDVAAAAVAAVSIVTTEDLSGNDFSCRVYISWK